MKQYRIRQILVPIDFSPLSMHALNHAQRLATEAGGQMTLLHVVEPYMDTLGVDSGMMSAALRLERDLQTVGMRRLGKIADTMRKRSSIRVDVRTVIGPIATAITRVASSTRSGLIVMGTHGTTGFFDNLLGSNTYRVSTLSRVPILSVHKRMKTRGYRHIIYPVRETAHAMKKLPHALTFAKLFKGQVHILGLLPPDEGRQKEMRSRCGAIERVLKTHRVSSKTTFSEGGQFSDTALRYVQRHPGALMVIQQDFDFRVVEMFSGTFTKKILHKVLSPVLTVPR